MEKTGRIILGKYYYKLIFWYCVCVSGCPEVNGNSQNGTVMLHLEGEFYSIGLCRLSLCGASAEEYLPVYGVQHKGKRAGFRTAYIV